MRSCSLRRIRSCFCLSGLYNHCSVLQMNRDIDQIISRVRARAPNVTVTQMHKINPGDDDGLWWFDVGDEKDNIQIESSNGMCPFLVETAGQCCANARTAESVDDAVNMIVKFCTSEQRREEHRTNGSRRRLVASRASTASLEKN